MARTLLDKVWEAHTVRILPSGQTQLLIGLHLIHEVTTPQAFQMLKELKLKVRMPERTFGTLDHIIRTADQTRPYADPEAEEMAAHMYRNMKDFGLQLFDMSTGKQGIVHVIGPELGLTQPGMTIACGDSHTSTHGAFGAVAFGIGTSQVRDVLASQCMAIEPLKVRRIRVTGQLPRGVYAKDVILTIIQRLGVGGGNGYAYEYAGDTIERAKAWWRSMASDPDAVYDDEVIIRAEELTPVVTWGVNPGQSVGVKDKVPATTADQQVSDALTYMGLTPGQPIAGMKV